MAATTILLVRHGHVEGIEERRFRGRQPLQLTTVGMRQAEQTGRLVRASSRPDLILSSPAARCVTTAMAIGAPLGLAPVPEPDLNDIDYGAWQGRRLQDVECDDPDGVKTWLHHPEQARISGGESLPAVSERACNALYRPAQPLTCCR